MIHAFLLVATLGGAPIVNNMYFYNIDRCLYFAQKVVISYGKQPERTPTAYCKPVYIKDTGQVYK